MSSIFFMGLPWCAAILTDPLILVSPSSVVAPLGAGSDRQAQGSGRATVTCRISRRHGWCARSTSRTGSNQRQIAQLIRRDKSWVYRRLVLVEWLTSNVESDVRLGLLSANVAREVSWLPRCNQEKAAQVIARRVDHAASHAVGRPAARRQQ
jgi:hypothetical protein